jgi:hypothetical protein
MLAIVSKAVAQMFAIKRFFIGTFLMFVMMSPTLNADRVHLDDAIAFIIKNQTSRTKKENQTYHPHSR